MNFNDYLVNCLYKKEMKQIVEISNLAYKNWGIYWSDFLPSYIYEQLLKDLNNLNDLTYFVFGGYADADIAKIACYRKAIQPEKKDLILKFPGKGIDIKGNFLFDNANQNDFRDFLINIGLSKNDLGDIWTLGEKGAQGIVSMGNHDLIEQEKYLLRDVSVQIKFLDLNDLKTPLKRIEKIINTVEASTRLDAIASAGFRVSRSKIIDRIKKGFLIKNGLKVKKSNVQIKVGDKIKLENKGIIEILEILPTKRERWKITLLKK